jgi:hypothetical protein
LTYASRVEVTWDEAKNLANRKRHGVSFEDASRLFTSGADYLELFDSAHSDLEERFIAIGPIEMGLVLVVWTERDEDVIRMISARWATAHEQALYHSHMEQFQ